MTGIYRIEVYTPGPRRLHGYYTLPILHHGHLIGRVDAKVHRGQQRLEVRSMHFEKWFAAGGRPPSAGRDPVDHDEALAGLTQTLNSLAAFLGAVRVSLGRVVPGRLRAPLARLLRAGVGSGAER